MILKNEDNLLIRMVKGMHAFTLKVEAMLA